MKQTICLLVAIVFSLTLAMAATNSTVKLPAKEKLHLYLMMGQSNMSGRGKIEAEDTTPHPRVLMFTTNAQWQPAVGPVTHDRPKMLGVGPGLAFGKAMVEKNPDATIALVPCSLGGTPLSRWQKGGDLYSNAVFRAKCAMRNGMLKGVLWHQGESDSSPGKAETYGERLDQMIRDLRTDVGVTNLPFVAGQLGEFLYTRGSNNVAEVRLVNDTLAKLPDRVPQTGYTFSAGLSHKGDQLHFDTASQREMGRRFAHEMICLQAE
jgi:hypothetical protein